MIKKEFLVIAIATFMTICAWVIFDILYARNEITISPQLQEVIEPLDPNFDITTLDLLK